MLSEKHVYFDVAHTRCTNSMLLYVDTYSGVECRVFINLETYIQGAPRTHCHPPHILQHYYTAECFRRIVLSASCNELRLMAPSIAAVSYFAIPYLVDPFSCIFFLHRIPHFSMKAEPQFLTGIF